MQEYADAKETKLHKPERMQVKFSNKNPKGNANTNLNNDLKHITPREEFFNESPRTLERGQATEESEVIIDLYTLTVRPDSNNFPQALDYRDVNIKDSEWR